VRYYVLISRIADINHTANW